MCPWQTFLSVFFSYCCFFIPPSRVFVDNKGLDMSTLLLCIQPYVWNAIAFLCCKRLSYFVKRWVTLPEKRVNLSIWCSVMLKACVVLSRQCLIMLKGHVVMINARVVISTQCLIMLKGYGVMLNSRIVLVHTECYYVKRLRYYVKNWFIFSTKDVNLSLWHVIMLYAYVVLSKQCLIILKCYVIMLNARAGLSTQCPVMLKCYLIMFKNGLSCLRSMWMYL